MIEFGALGVAQRVHLFGREHAGHECHRPAGLIHVRHSLHRERERLAAVANQRFMKLISSDCELLIRAPSNRKSLFSVCDEIQAVITTACSWCMIMPCMNSTSAGDGGGSIPFVEAGSRLVGWPGAPGWTTTGAEAESDCWACAGEDAKPTETLAAKSMPKNSAVNLGAWWLRSNMRRKSYRFCLGHR